MTERCAWAAKSTQLLLYHDLEWGVPTRDERQLFENLSLEIFQAGLNWQLVLSYRPALREALYDFDPERLALLTREQVEALYGNEPIIRNHQKIDAIVTNAKVLVALHDLDWSFSEAVWANAVLFRQVHEADVVARFNADLVHTLSHLGFKRIGLKSCYAFLQASGVVNDHDTGCYRRAELL